MAGRRPALYLLLFITLSLSDKVGLKLWCVQGPIPKSLGLPFPVNISLDVNSYAQIEDFASDIKSVCSIPAFIGIGIRYGNMKGAPQLQELQLLRDGAHIHVQLAMTNVTMATAMLQWGHRLFAKHYISFFLEGVETYCKDLMM